MINPVFRRKKSLRLTCMKKAEQPRGLAVDTRERILRTASELFYREGTRAVGVDLIVAQAGVAKTSLYRHFGTKDELIEAFLHLEDEDFWRHWDAVAAQHRGAPRAELDAQLQWIGERIARPGYRGCPQINIAAEYADENHPARKVAVAHKRELRQRLADLAQALRVEKPETFALRMGTVIDGALSSGHALHAEGPVRFLQELAQMLIPKRTRK
jgi:AcrR family transcriptional regulator